MIGTVYHEDYNKYDLGVNHFLVGNKSGKTMEFFEEKGRKKINDDVLRDNVPMISLCKEKKFKITDEDPGKYKIEFDL